MTKNEDTQRNVAKILQDAHEAAAIVHEKTMPQIEHIKKAARKKGKKKAEIKCRDLQEQVVGIKNRIAADLPQEIIDASFLAAAALLNNYARRGETTFAVICKVLPLIPNAKNIKLFLSTADVAQIMQQKEQLQTFLVPGAQVTMQADPQLNRGDVMLHSEFGVIDAQLKTQLKNLAASIS